MTDCIHLNRDSSDYILVLDYDEFPMINFDNYPNPAPNQQLLNFLKNLDMEIGSYEMTRIPISTIMEKGITPNENSLYQDQLDCINGKDDKVKTFYKSKTVIAVNQHKKTVGVSSI